MRVTPREFAHRLAPEDAREMLEELIDVMESETVLEVLVDKLEAEDLSELISRRMQ